jgi:hypothetical protein
MSLLTLQFQRETPLKETQIYCVYLHPLQQIQSGDIQHQWHQTLTVENLGRYITLSHET